jgi:hypothetical protein
LTQIISKPAASTLHEAAAARSWRVSIIRSRGQLLGVVKAPSREAAEAAAAQMFELGDEQRRRLMVQEGG